MNFHRHFLPGKRQLGFALTLIVTLAWLVQNVHVRVPVKTVKNTSHPFPCQFNGCGCKDAVQCWSSCGCFSDAEKIAWAKENSAQPPDWFLEDLKERPVTGPSNEVSPPSGGCGCCCKKHQPTVKRENKPLTVATSTAPVAKSKSQTKTRRVYLSLKQRRKCQGQYDVDSIAFYFTPVADRSPKERLCLSLYATGTFFRPAAYLPPPTPPPQRI
jgi:hypothetical protein